jgi:1-acyl-sn-glycerol-3-phosphate acyltransferase
MADASMTDATAQARTAEALLGVVDAALRALSAGAPGMPSVSLQSRLDRDLGLDSLARMDLMLRTEREFGVELPQDTLQRAETVADLLQAVLQCAAAPGRPSGTPRTAVRTSQLAPSLENAVVAGPGVAGATTLPGVLDWHVQAHPDQTQIVLLQDEVEQTLSYRQLADAAGGFAAGLQRAGVEPRQCVAIMLPTSAEYFSTYLGILKAGAIPVPIYPPARASQLEDHVLRHAGILANARAVLLVTVPEAMGVARLLQARVPDLRRVATAQELAATTSRPAPVALRGDDIAFIQYTSGSTGDPKGVALTHDNLLANIRAMAQAIQATPRDVFVSWLPLYHDMGLIGAWLGSLYVGFPLVVMSPLAFLSRPLRWLQAIQRYRGTLSAGPNFSYELCLKRIDDAALAGLDLSSWRLAFNGAEAVSPDTVRRFTSRFAACGLKAQAMAPVYGLAEASVGLLFPPLGRVAPIDAVQREPFTHERRAMPAGTGDTDALRFVGCGRVLAGHAVRVLDEAGHEVAERVEGRLEFKGPSATHGYYRNPAQTAKLFHDGWLDTGDRAYIADGEVYITGRVKDIVIRGGRNLYPQEIEEAVGQVEGVRQGCVAVFGSPDPAAGTERLVVLAEVRPGAADARLHDAVSQAVFGAIGEPADVVLLAPPHTVLKTSSGKVRRSACRALFEAGAIGTAPATARRQVLRLALGGVGLQLRRALARLAGTLWGLWAVLLMGMLAPPTWLAIRLAPDPAAAWRRAGAAARLLLRLAAVPLTVRGVAHLPAGACVLVSNHASYLDGMILVAALPRSFAFVAKRELKAQALPGPALRRLGVEFVERFDVQQGVADANHLADAVQRGTSLLVFPEGTFVERPGLLPFHLGAFLAAARAGVPVVPLAIRGARDLLPADRWWPHRTALEVHIGDPIAPTAAQPDVFAAAVRLREAARHAIETRVEET